MTCQITLRERLRNLSYRGPAPDGRGPGPDVGSAMHLRIPPHRKSTHPGKARQHGRCKSQVLLTGFNTPPRFREYPGDVSRIPRGGSDNTLLGFPETRILNSGTPFPSITIALAPAAHLRFNCPLQVYEGGQGQPPGGQQRGRTAVARGHPRGSHDRDRRLLRGPAGPLPPG